MLAALRAKGETADEIRGFARAMRELALRPAIPPGAYVDIVGTGGDGSGSLNLSTGASLLAAACGLPVVKHGNRSVSSKSGSADVLAALGLPIPLDEAAAGACLAHCGFTFLFAPHYHPATKNIAAVRQALGVRTVFNILGPLANPAAPPFHVIGAFSDAMAASMADTLAGLADDARVRRAWRSGLGRSDAGRPVRLLRRAPGPRRAHACATRATQASSAARSTTCAAPMPRATRHGCARRSRAATRPRIATRSCSDAALALEVTGAEPDARSAVARARTTLASGAGTRLLDRIAAFAKEHAE